MPIEVGHSIPEKFNGLERSECSIVRFRCPHCQLAHQATVLPGSPQTAKFHCRQCERTIEVQTRESAMDQIENEFNLRLDMKNVAARPRAYSKAPTPIVQTRFGPAHLIG